MYLDDGFGCHRDCDKAYEMFRQVYFDMVSSGFIPKAKKSVDTLSKIRVFRHIHEL